MIEYMALFTPNPGSHELQGKGYARQPINLEAGQRIVEFGPATDEWEPVGRTAIMAHLKGGPGRNEQDCHVYRYIWKDDTFILTLEDPKTLLELQLENLRLHKLLNTLGVLSRQERSCPGCPECQPGQREVEVAHE